jgi:hypothetical protein
MSSTTNFVKAKNFKPQATVYKPPKVTSRGGKHVDIQLNSRQLILQFPLMLTWGVNERVDESSGRVTGYDLALQFEPEKFPSQSAMLQNLKEFQEKVMADCVENSREWFGKSKMTKEVVEALMYPILKYPKTKLENGQWGDPDYSRNPTMKIKIPFWEGSWNTEIYNMDGKLQYKPQRDGVTFEATGTPSSLIPKGSFIKGLIQCNGMWFTGGKCGLTWKLVQSCVEPPTYLVGSGKCQICDDSDDEEALENLRSKSVKNTVDIPPYGEEAEVTSTSKPTFMNDSEEEEESQNLQEDEGSQEEEEEEEEEVVAPPPKKKKTVRKKRTKVTANA